MLRRVTLLALFSMLILNLPGCGAPPPQEEPKTEAPPPPPKPVETVPVYELTKDEITSHADWTSRNISILGVKLGDVTRNVEKNLGKLDNTRTLPDEYLTVYQNNGVFVYTTKLTGKARQIEVNKGFAKQVADPKLKKLLDTGTLKDMRDLFGMEEGEPVPNADEMSTEYPYDSRGFRFVQFKLGGQTINALRFVEKKAAT